MRSRKSSAEIGRRQLCFRNLLAGFLLPVLFLGGSATLPGEEKRPDGLDAERKKVSAAAASLSAGCSENVFLFLANHVAQLSPASPAQPLRLDLSAWKIEDETPVPLWREELPEAVAYFHVMGQAARLTPKALADGSRRDREYLQLFNEPAVYRGEAIRVEGILKQMRRFKPPGPALKYGVRDLYEGWIFDKKIDDANPICLIFTELPDNLEVGEKIYREVVFDGFFFKKQRKRTGNGEWRDELLVIGRAPRAKNLPLLPPMSEQPPDQAVKLDLSPWTIIDHDGIPTFETKYKTTDEPAAYVHVLVTAHRMPVESFSRGARRDLTFTHLFQQAGDYRGEPVHVEGVLRRIRRWDPPLLAKQAGVRDLYEGWMFHERIYGAQMCVIFTELPPDLEVKEEMYQRVAFDGYLFKRFRHDTGERNKKTGGVVWRESPLLIGHAPILLDKPAAAEEDAASIYRLLLIILALVGGTIWAALGLAYWYRRSDHKIRARLAEANALRFAESAAALEKSLERESAEAPRTSEPEA